MKKLTLKIAIIAEALSPERPIDIHVPSSYTLCVHFFTT